MASQRPLPRHASSSPFSDFFSFKGAYEYLEDLVTCIDALRLVKLYITFFNEIVFGTPHFIQFIGRIPTLEALKKASVSFEDGGASIYLSSQTISHLGLNMRIPCKELDWQVSSPEQICTSCSPPLSILEDLYISEFPYWPPARQCWEHAVVGTVKSIYCCEESLPI